MEKDTIVNMKLKDIKLDSELLECRPIDKSTVSRYQSAMRFDGVESFPLMYIDKKTKKLISGNHRYKAMLNEYGENHSVDVKVRSYKDRREQVEHAVSENMKFGKQLQGFQAARFRKWLYELNTPMSRIAQLFDKSEKVITKEIAGLKVVYIGTKRKTKTIREQTQEAKKNGTVRREPVKRSIPDSVESMTETQWEEHKDKDIGVRVPLLADQIIRHLKNDFIDPSFISTLQELYLELGDYLSKLEKVQVS